MNYLIQLKTFSYRVLKEDCLDLPEKIYMKREIELSPDQRRLYKQMKEEALATLNGKQITTVNDTYSINEIATNYLWSFY